MSPLRVTAHQTNAMKTLLTLKAVCG